MSTDLPTPEEPWNVVTGEALGALAGLPDASFDGLVTDPPYSSGGAFRADRMAATGVKYVQTGQKLAYEDFPGDNRDQRSFGFWCSFWLTDAYRVLKQGAPVCLFTDWRQLPTMTDALQAGGFVWRGIFAWDKTEATRPVLGRFRSQCEYVVWGSKGPMSVERGVPVLPGAVSIRVDPAEKYHQTGKPVEVMEAVCAIVEPGGLILDPFCGSASTGVAALRQGKRFFGVEMTAHYAEVARERLASVASGLTLRQRREAEANPQTALPL